MGSDTSESPQQIAVANDRIEVLSIDCRSKGQELHE